MDLAMVNHLFVTPRFLIKGRIATGDLRLSSFLTANRRPFLRVEDMSLLEWTTGSRVMAASGELRSEDIVIAHEFLEVSGDAHRRALAEDDEQTFRTASFYLRAPCSWELFGRVKREALGTVGSEALVVVREPEIRGLQTDGLEGAEILQRLPYVILNTTFVHCLFQYA